MHPIPVTEQLPECIYFTRHIHGGACSESVLVFANGWMAGVFVRPEDGAAYWEHSTEGISGYEWEVDRIEGVTHWTPFPPAPTDTGD
jgi:hypothetical protein